MLGEPRKNQSGGTESPLPGRVIGGQFVLGALIGSGSMGEVFEARHLTTGMDVAIKMLRPRLAEDQDLLRRFRKEALSASMLKHPNSVLILHSEHSDSGDAPYIVMERLCGHTLAHVLWHDGPMPIARVVRIMCQVLSAVGEAHAHGIVHRDLKPENIMLIDRDGAADFVKVCDFGMAKVFRPRVEPSSFHSSLMTARGILCGTPEYMSPEQARDEILDGRADLYSVSALLYQMVAGDVPFRAASAMGVLSRQITETPEPPSRRRIGSPLPPALERLILRGLAKDRRDRPQSADEFRSELEQIGEPADDVDAVNHGAWSRGRSASSPVCGHGQGMLETLVPVEANQMTQASRFRPRRAVMRVAIGAGIALSLGAGSLLVGTAPAARDHVSPEKPSVGMPVLTVLAPKEFAVPNQPALEQFRLPSAKGSAPRDNPRSRGWCAIGSAFAIDRPRSPGITECAGAGAKGAPK